MNKILLVFLLMLQFRVDAQIALTAETMPFFAGCEDIEEAEKRNCSNSKLISFISSNLKYPQEAREEGIEGTIYSQFVVNTHGEVEQIKILNYIGDGFEDEVIRVIKSMPTWIPGTTGGVAQNIQLKLPISFSLNQGKYNESQKYTISWGNLKEPSISRKELKKNIGKELIIRDEFGNDRMISELIFSFERGSNYIEAKSRGIIEKRLRKIVRKSKKGGIFSIKIIILDGKDFKTIKKDYQII